MTPTEIFIERCRSSGLPYVTEAIRCLRDGTGRLHSEEQRESTASSEDLLCIYERRAAHLATIETNHAKIMKVDAEMLCDSLREKKGSRYTVWLVERDPYFTYSFFETTDDHRFLGVIKSVDDRKLSEADRMIFWGKK